MKTLTLSIVFSIACLCPVFSDGLSYSGGGVEKITAGSNITISPSNGHGNVTINSSGGGGGSGVSTTSFQLGFNSAVYLATAAHQTPIRWMFSPRSTVTISEMSAYCSRASTVNVVTINLAVSTGTGANPEVFTGIHSASMTIERAATLQDTKYATATYYVPDRNLGLGEGAVIYPRQYLLVQTTVVPTSGDLPYGCYATFNYWYWPR